MDRNSCLNYFQAFPFWEHMTEEDRNFLLDNIRELHYPAGAAIQSEERQCLGTLFLLKGVLRVYLLSAQGKEATLYRLGTVISALFPPPACFLPLHLMYRSMQKQTVICFCFRQFLFPG